MTHNRLGHLVKCHLCCKHPEALYFSDFLAERQRLKPGIFFIVRAVMTW
ncbi:Uncharacterised protein [Halioglobus japonicus]|nr:Uncharacterised protein [Halioglobus japonicus]